ncbi:hypothetical protein [Burkholderia thailandensis]|uniref:hypothetical protein n=1 Tax=Burkholderia thailandensis TaxID=57975 RepID=UPI001E484218|nr:hypothetical protein [Burkholderia thailandensis]
MTDSSIGKSLPEKKSANATPFIVLLDHHPKQRTRALTVGNGTHHDHVQRRHQYLMV